MRLPTTVHLDSGGAIHSEVSTEEGSGVESIPSDKSPVGKLRLLKNIYESCTFTLNVADPFTYEEVVKTEV